MPTKVLVLCFKVIPHRSAAVRKLIAVLAWVTEEEVGQYYSEKAKALEAILRSDQMKETWKEHHLYTSNTLTDLEELCHKLRIPVNASLCKHDLVHLTGTKRGEEIPSDAVIYTGDFSTIPGTVSAITKLSVAKLKVILHHHHESLVGNKNELVIWVYLLNRIKQPLCTIVKNNS